jgi:putative ABC transport system substrate-binding protein
MASHIERRKFLATLGSAAAWPLATRAQPSGKTYLIGFLGVFSYPEYRRLVEALRTGLRKLGYEEGRNIVIEYRWAEGRYDRLPELATELVNLKPDVIVTHSAPGARAAKQATATVPVVFAAVGDPVAFGLIENLHRPGGNLTGSTFFWTEVGAKRVELIKEAIPALTRVAVLVNPASPALPIAVSAMQRTARALGMELVPLEVNSRDDIATAIAAAAAQRLRALALIEEPLVVSNAREIADLGLQSRVPMIGFKPQAEAGALMEYGVDLADLYFRAASFVHKILKGTPPGELPIERAVKFDLIVNLKTAKTLGIELPTPLLIRANEVIE